MATGLGVVGIAALQLVASHVPHDVPHVAGTVDLSVFASDSEAHPTLEDLFKADRLVDLDVTFTWSSATEANSDGAPRIGGPLNEPMNCADELFATNDALAAGDIATITVPLGAYSNHMLLTVHPASFRERPFADVTCAYVGDPTLAGLSLRGLFAVRHESVPTAVHLRLTPAPVTLSPAAPPAPTE